MNGGKIAVSSSGAIYRRNLPTQSTVVGYWVCQCQKYPKPLAVLVASKPKLYFMRLPAAEGRNDCNL